MRGATTAFSLALCLMVAACNKAQSQPDSGNLFAFFDVERMVLQPPGEDGDPNSIAFAYEQKLRTFASMYGDGVGPAKHTPAFRDCRRAFDEVAVVAAAPSAAEADDQSLPLARKLITCRHAADNWSSAAEMATFGNDVHQMVAGSMVVLGARLRAGAHAKFGSELVNRGLGLLKTYRKSA